MPFGSEVKSKVKENFGKLNKEGNLADNVSYLKGQRTELDKDLKKDHS